jgi:hypothetical protein
MTEVNYTGTNPPQSLRIQAKSTRKFTSTADLTCRADQYCAGEQDWYGYGSYTSGVEYSWIADSELPVCMNNRTYIDS